MEAVPGDRELTPQAGRSAFAPASRAVVIPVVRQRGTVAELHALDPFAADDVGPTVWWCDPSDDAIVLGSRQSESAVDLRACERVGLHVAHRRSGGGAVIIRRRQVHWIDVVLPTGVAPDDVRGSMEWVGACWHVALEAHTTDRLRVHLGGMESSPWSDLVCFAGVGPGEILAEGGKLVGLSQRRTRRGIRVQALLYDTPVAAEYRELLTGPLPAGVPPVEATIAGVDTAAVATSLATALAGRIPSV